MPFDVLFTAFQLAFLAFCCEIACRSLPNTLLALAHSLPDSLPFVADTHNFTRSADLLSSMQLRILQVHHPCDLWCVAMILYTVLE